MKSDPRCIPCLVRQLERSAKALHLPADEFDALIARARKEVANIPLSLPPNIYSTRLLEMIYRDGADPYKEEKARHNREVADILPLVRRMVKRSDNPKRTALLAASLGNIIDLGTIEHIDTGEIKEFLENATFERDDSPELLRKVEEAQSMVYVVDNAGEVLLDSLCAEILGVPQTIFVAKESPILNDVTTREMIELGFSTEKVTSTGTNDLGINWETLNPEVRQLMRDADVVIAKGHANFESFIDGPQEAFLLLKIKCEVVAEKIGEDCGSLVCMHYLPQKNASPSFGDPE
ncbi:hypothetical protein CEE36_01345 [candidate division TA06 bacterium B3_TA06]|uniref:Damage-control phosphatase ARMT1-like metal-binding domain-containing protein n=1 Tax=candidate division TA06 bacterium B3_TA06 TaxID=2012487 RepID=A0A532VB43_UNCT6|nr:MAG: hypothetical protein CEE36_01345 [candidate division TA06 bacterium B3_TA06]